MKLYYALMYILDNLSFILLNTKQRRQYVKYFLFFANM